MEKNYNILATNLEDAELVRPFFATNVRDMKEIQGNGVALFTKNSSGTHGVDSLQKVEDPKVSSKCREICTLLNMPTAFFQISKEYGCAGYKSTKLEVADMKDGKNVYNELLSTDYSPGGRPTNTEIDALFQVLGEKHQQAFIVSNGTVYMIRAFFGDENFENENPANDKWAVIAYTSFRGGTRGTEPV